MTLHEGQEPAEGPNGSSIGPDARRRVVRVAMLIDWDNFYSQCAERGIVVRPARLKEIGRRAGRLRWSAIFVDATRLTTTQRIQLFTEGFDICDCPKLPSAHTASLKDTVDAAIIGRLHAVADFVEVDEILLGSADRDYLRVVQHLRDAGKRVRIITPTPRDRPTLVQHSDGFVAYAVSESAEGIARDVAAIFGRGAFVPNDQRSAAALRSLAKLVVLMDSRLNVNGCSCGFRRLMDELMRADEIRAEGLSPEALKDRLEFLIDRDVVLREQDERKFYRYRVSRAHPFVAFAYKDAGALVVRPTPAPLGRERTGECVS